MAIGTNITERKRAEAYGAELNRQLIETSRKAGMAEVATSVLHNVGNVLTSVSVSATLVADMVSASKVLQLHKVIALLDAHAQDLPAFFECNPQGQRLPDYLKQLDRILTQEHQIELAELASLTKHIEHIKAIVAMQQRYAKISAVTDTLKVTELVEDAVRINAESLPGRDIQLVRDYQDVPEMSVEKHKVLQILVNLLRNAKFACDESGRADKQIKLRVWNEDNHTCVGVTDNGVGIPAENLDRIFNFGFTTRKGGHGFGLHSGALAAREIGGELRVLSEGRNKGATFVLSLPARPVELPN